MLLILMFCWSFKLTARKFFAPGGVCFRELRTCELNSEENSTLLALSKFLSQILGAEDFAGQLQIHIE